MNALLVRLLPILILMSAQASEFDAWLQGNLPSGVSASKAFLQDPVQKLCSDREAPAEDLQKSIEAQALTQIPLPRGGYWGRVSEGERLAYGTSDSAGNCVGCHHLQKKDVAFGTLGPDLEGYGRRKTSQDYLRVWQQLYDAKAFKLCSAMPRYGHQGILDESALKDLMSFLLDPDSPVNH